MHVAAGHLWVKDTFSILVHHGIEMFILMLSGVLIPIIKVPIHVNTASNETDKFPRSTVSWLFIKCPINNTAVNNNKFSQKNDFTDKIMTRHCKKSSFYPKH